MVLNNFNFFKFSFFIIFLILGTFLIIRGFYNLNNVYTKIDKIPLNNKEINLKNFDIQKKTDLENKTSNDELKNNLISVKKNQIIKNDLEETIVSVKKNDTFSKIIDPYFDKKIKNLIINKLNKKLNFEYLKVGQKIFFYQNSNGEIVKIIIPKNLNTEIVVKITPNNLYVTEETIEIVKEVNSKKLTIISSLYEDGIKANLPASVLSDAIRLYSFDIDFQRDIKKNTIFEICYEIFYNNKRNTYEYGTIQYINLIIQNKELEYFVFKTEDGYFDYFNKKGKNIKKSLLKTPIDGARLSSNFGMRKHPISGYNKLHKGVDFAAPTGTPVYAGGNGVIEFIGYNGGYGKYIRIRHNNMYKTAYAHLSGYKKGISVGKRVNQGETIGYVGSTGRSTGPHLHYEIIYKNKQVNPMKLKLPSGKVLDGEELKKFNKKSKEIYAKHLFALYE